MMNKVPLFIILFVPILLYHQYGGSSVKTHQARTTVVSDSDGKKTDTITRDRNRANIQQTWSRRQLDSMFRPINFFVVDMDSAGEVPWEHVDWRYIDSLYKSGYWRSRDTAWVLLGDSCLQIRASLGRTPDVPDTLKFVSLCKPNCFAPKTVPLGCWDSVRVEVPTPYNKWVCDTLCYYPVRVLRDTSYAVLSPEQMGVLATIHEGQYGVPCDTSRVEPPSRVTVCGRWINGTWVFNMKETQGSYPHRTCPPGTFCDEVYCCINRNVLVSYLLDNPGLWVQYEWIDSSLQVVNCGDYWGIEYQRKLIKTTIGAPCEYVTDTTITYRYEPVFIPNGDDTTIYIDTCQTKCPKFTVSCLTERYDTTRKIDSIFEWGGYKYDTLYDNNCRKLVTKITSFGATTVARNEDTLSRSAYWKIISTLGCATSRAPGYVPIRKASIEYATWPSGRIDTTVDSSHVYYCQFNDASLQPPGGYSVVVPISNVLLEGYAQYCWVPKAALLALAASDTSVDLSGCDSYCKPYFTTTREWSTCCEKDTVYVMSCPNPDFPEDSTKNITTPYPAKVPVLPCDDYYTIKATPDPTLKVFVRLDTSYVVRHIEYDPPIYTITWEDSCACDPRIITKSGTLDLCRGIEIRCSETDDIMVKDDGSGTPILYIPCNNQVTINGETSTVFSLPSQRDVDNIYNTIYQTYADVSDSLDLIRDDIQLVRDTMEAGLIRPSERDRYAVDSTKLTAGANIELTGDPITGYTIAATMPSISGEGGIVSLQGIYSSQIMLKDTLGRFQFTGVTYDSSIQISLKADTAIAYTRDTSSGKFWNLRDYWPLASDTSKVKGIVDLARAYLDTSGNGAWYYKLPKISFDMINGLRDSSRTWRTYMTGSGAIKLDSTGSNYTITIKPDSVLAYVRDTSAGAFWQWSQAGIVITDTAKIKGILGFDTTKFQGLPEADPVFGSALPTLRLISDTVKPIGTVTWTQIRGEVKDSLEKVVRFEVDPLAVKKADSASYSIGYITFKRLSDTLNANPRTGPDTSGYGAWWYKLSKAALDVLSGVHDTSRTWRTYNAGLGSVQLDSTGAFYTVKLRPDSVAAFMRDTSSGAFWNWSQAGVVITDSSKIQGLPEADPLAVRKADSASYSLGYITPKRLSDSLNANPRVGTDTSGLAFWNWSQAPETDPTAVKKADSTSYAQGYITFKRLTDTLNTIPRSSIAGTDTSGNGAWWYKLSKESFDMMMGTRDTSRTWKTIVSLTGNAVTNVDSSTSGRYRYTLTDTSGAFIIGQYFALSDTNKILSGKFKAALDSIQALRTKLDSIQTVLDQGKVVCGRTTIGGDGLIAINWPSEPLAVMPTYIDGDPTIPLRWSWSGTQIIIKGDANWEISYCVQGSYTP